MIERICTVTGAEDESPVVFVAGEVKGASLRAVYHAKLLPESKVELEEITKAPKGFSGMQVTSNGTVVVLMVKEQVWVIKSRNGKWDIKKYSLPETLKCMDILPVREATEVKGKKKATGPSGGHVIVGDKKGALYILHDVLLPAEKRPKVEKKEGEQKGEKQKAPVAQKAPMVPKKLHWHREAVASVKWALNGELQAVCPSQTFANINFRRICYFRR